MSKEVWQRGLLQNPAKIPCLVIGTVGSNPTTSALENCPRGLWCKLGKFVWIKPPEVRILYSPLETSYKHSADISSYIRGLDVFLDRRG